ncbi:MAG: hypothetical protein GEV03_08795 [Streptosporangiales bacterium]|nr:hypothetical protein [Streptosporangiales bacterium]
MFGLTHCATPVRRRSGAELGVSLRRRFPDVCIRKGWPPQRSPTLPTAWPPRTAVVEATGLSRSAVRSSPPLPGYCVEFGFGYTTQQATSSSAVPMSPGVPCRFIVAITSPLGSFQPQGRGLLEVFMQIAEIEEVVRQEFAAVLGLPPDEIGTDQHFYDDLKGDSLQKLEIVARLEDRLGVKMSDDDEQALNTLANLTTMLAAKLAG